LLLIVWNVCTIDILSLGEDHLMSLSLKMTIPLVFHRVSAF
jgi:hypothetical protein